MCSCGTPPGYRCASHRPAELNTAAIWEHGNQAGVTITNKDNLFVPNAIKIQLTPDEMIQLGSDLVSTGLRLKKPGTYRGVT